MEVTDVQITPIKPKDGLIAFANVVIDNCIQLGFIGVHTKLDGSGYRLTYPTKKAGIKDLNIYYPVNKEMSKMIESAVFTKVDQIMLS